jgi:glutathione S-transferase
VSSSNISTGIIPAPRNSSPAIPIWRGKRGCATYDLYLHLPMQKIMLDRLRPEGKKDPHGVEEARAQLRTSYRMIEVQMADNVWAMGDAFSLADCAALPPLYYGNMVEPFGEFHKNVTAYFERLKARPSVARVLDEAEPYFNLVPK